MDPTNITNFIATHQWIIVLAAVWTIPWKGVALWKAARNSSIAWFVALLLINTMGILDIIYIFAFSRTKVSSEVQILPEPPIEKKTLDIKKDN